METRKKISIAVLGAMCCLQFSGVARAEEEDKPTANLAVAALSKYVWRGFEVTRNSMVLEPSMTVAYKGFSANVWGNLDTDYYGSGPNSGTNFWNETDFTLAYDWTMGPVGMTAGYIYYAFDGLPDTQEVFARAAWHVLLTPTLSIYRDYQNLAGWYITLGVSHTIPITEKIGVSLGAQAGYLDAADASSYAEVNASNWTYTDKSFNGFHDGLLSVSVPIQANKYITVTPVLNYSFPLSGKSADLIEIRSLNGGGSGDNNFVYGGVTVSMAF